MIRQGQSLRWFLVKDVITEGCTLDGFVYMKSPNMQIYKRQISGCEVLGG